MKPKKFLSPPVIIVILITAVIVGLFVKAQYSTKSPRITTRPDYSQNRTIKEEENLVTIDFERCTLDVRRIYVDFGSTTIEIKGKEKGLCKLNFGGEVENPNWDGRLTNKCDVPTKLGKVIFTKGQYGLDLSKIQQYCSKM